MVSHLEKYQSDFRRVPYPVCSHLKPASYCLTDQGIGEKIRCKTNQNLGRLKNNYQGWSDMSDSVRWLGGGVIFHCRSIGQKQFEQNSADWSADCRPQDTLIIGQWESGFRQKGSLSETPVPVCSYFWLGLSIEEQDFFKAGVPLPDW